jgi:hypothetical protein
LESDYNLVHQIFVVSTTEYSFRRIKLGCGLALVIQEFELH